MSTKVILTTQTEKIIPETIEIETPCYFTDGYAAAMVTDTHLIWVYKDHVSASKLTLETYKAYTQFHKPATREEFLFVLENSIYNLRVLTEEPSVMDDLREDEMGEADDYITRREEETIYHMENPDL